MTENYIYKSKSVTKEEEEEEEINDKDLKIDGENRRINYANKNRIIQKMNNK